MATTADLERELAVVRERSKADLAQLERMNQALVDQAAELRTQAENFF